MVLMGQIWDVRVRVRVRGRVKCGSNWRTASWLVSSAFVAASTAFSLQ